MSTLVIVEVALLFAPPQFDGPEKNNVVVNFLLLLRRAWPASSPSPPAAGLVGLHGSVAHLRFDTVLTRAAVDPATGAQRRDADQGEDAQRNGVLGRGGWRDRVLCLVPTGSHFQSGFAHGHPRCSFASGLDFAAGVLCALVLWPSGTNLLAKHQLQLVFRVPLDQCEESCRRSGY